MTDPPDTNTRHSFIALLAIVFALVFSGFGFVQAQLVNGEFCYALDDSFIMMAISKNLALHHVWGLTAYEFSSTASSPLFTILLAGIIFLIGDHIWIPLVVNIFALSGLFFWLAAQAKNWKLNSWQTWFLLMGTFYFMPVPVLLFGSMEHILHTWIAIYCLQQIIEKEDSISLTKLLILGVCLAGIRYEGLFEGTILIVWLWKNKQIMKGIALGVGMLIPVCWLGFYSLSQGWFFLPNSLVLKGYGMNIQETKNVFGFLVSWISKATSNTHAIVAMVVLYFCYTWKGSEKHKNRLWLGLALGCCILHFIFARYNHVYRYEAYLMAISWIVFWKTVTQSQLIRNYTDLKKQLFESPTQAILYLALAASPLFRSIDSYSVGSRAMVNIFEQQVQSAQFVKRYYDKAVVGAIDVGAIAYYSNCRLLDLWGLGDLDIARLKLNNTYNPKAINAVCQNKKMEIAIAYGNNLDHPDWNIVESWIIYNNAVCSQDTIVFYAVSPTALPKLKSNLNQFHSLLPKTVKVVPFSRSENAETL